MSARTRSESMEGNEATPDYRRPTALAICIARILRPLSVSAWTCGMVFSCIATASAATLTVSGAAPAGQTYDVSGNETDTLVTVGNNAGETGTININAGNTLTTGSSGTTGTLLGHNATASGTINISGTGAKYTDNGNAYIGEVGSGSINIFSGGTLLTGSASSDTTYLGSQSGASGTVTVDGSGSTWTNTGTLSLGYGGNGTGTVQVQNGGSAVINGTVSVDKGNVTVTGAGSTFTVNDHGGHLYSGSRLIVSDGGTLNFTSSNPTIGSFYVTGGSALQISGTGTTMRIHNSANNTSWLTVISGSSASLTNGGYLSTDGGYIGGTDSTLGQMTVSGANTRWDSMVRIYVGGSSGGTSTGNGKLTVSGGATVTSATGGVALDTNSNGSMILTGQGTTFSANANSAISALGNFYVSYGGTGTVLVTDGALLHADHHISIATASGSSGTLSIGAAQGSTAAAPGTITTPSIDFGAGTGKLVFNHTSTDYVFAPNITGPDTGGSSAIGLYGGSTRFTGDLSSFTGTMTVDGGTLSVAAPQTLSLGGDYQQNAAGILKIGTISGSSHGKLAVTGSATFAAGTGINVDVSSASKLAAGETLPGVVSAGSLNASTFNLTDNSALFDFTATVNSSTIDLNMHKAATVVSSVKSTGLNSGVGAAQVLDGFVSNGTTGGDTDNVVTALGKLSTDQQVSDAVAQTLPLLVSGTSQVETGTLHTINRVIQARQSSFIGMSSGDGFLTDKHLWLKPVGSWTRQSNRNGVSGYTADSYGLVGGMDGDINDSTKLGFALSYMNSNVNGSSTASGSSATIDAYQAIFYGSHSLQNLPDVEVNWQADVGINKNEGKRYMSFISRTANANYDSYTGHVGAGIGKRFQVSDSTAIIPSIRADYAYIKDDSYTESGAGALNLNVNSNSAQELIAMAKGNLSHTLNDKATLVADLGVGYDFINDQTSLTASYTGGGIAFTTKGINPSPWLADVGAGINYAVSDTSTITARYDVEGRRSFLNQTASVKFRWLF